MTPAPRDAARLPVAYGVGGRCQFARERGRSPEAVDQVHSALSQIVSGKSRPFTHNLGVGDFWPDGQDDEVDFQDKNGGPNHLRAWREYRKLSQARLAEMAGTSANMIQYLESGERGLSLKWLRRLAPALQTTPGMISDHDPNDLDSDIIEIWATRSPDEKRQIARVIDALADERRKEGARNTG